MQKNNPKILYIAAGVIAVVALAVLYFDSKGTGETSDEVLRSLPVVSGHRGANCIAPENTMASADSCIRYHVDFMETDVAMSSDGVFYLLHDRTLDRTTDLEGEIGLYPSAVLDTVDAGKWFGEQWKGQTLPRFETLLRKAHDNNLNVTIDYRNGAYRDLVDLCKATGMLERTCFTFTEESDAIAFRKEFPEIKTLQGYITDINDIERAVEAYSPNIVVNWIDNMDQAFVDKCHSMGMEVLALILGLDDKTELNQKAVDLGVDVVATDRPVAFRRQFGYDQLGL